MLSSGFYCPAPVYLVHTCAAPGTERCCHQVSTVLHLFNMYIPVLHQEQREAVIKFVPSSTCLTCTYPCCTRNRETLSSGFYCPPPVYYIHNCAAPGTKRCCHQVCTILHLLACRWRCCTINSEMLSSGLYCPPPV